MVMLLAAVSPIFFCMEFSLSTISVNAFRNSVKLKTWLENEMVLKLLYYAFHHS